MGTTSLADLAFQPVTFAPGAAELDVPARENLGKLTEMLLNRQQLHLVFCAPATRQDWQAAYAPEQLGQPDGNGKKPEDGPHQGEATSEAVSEASSESAVPEITDEQQAALVRLADRRTEAAKAYLVDAGVKPGQVIPCTGEFQVGRDSAPEMTISIGQ
jgi:outer membrane protein OmpA-like peptidoglycan-associated protein